MLVVHGGVYGVAEEARNWDSGPFFKDVNGIAQIHCSNVRENYM